jgi:hypothetical protein
MGNDTIFGLMVGLISLTITLMLEVIARLSKSESLLAETVMLSNILSDDSLRQPIRDIVNYYQRIAKYEHDEFQRHAGASIDQCRATLQEIASGIVRNESVKDIQEAGFREFKRVLRDVKAIHVDPMTFWTDDWGTKYFATNQAALKRGVKVTRIFALTDAEARDNIEILKEHQRAGVHVLILKPDLVSGESLIFDERILVYYEKNADGSYKTENIIVDPIRVNNALKEFEQLAGHPYTKSIKDIEIKRKPKKGG